MEKIAFPPKPDRHTYRQTYIHTDGRTDISVYRVASLLKKKNVYVIVVVIIFNHILFTYCFLQYYDFYIRLFSSEATL